MQLIALDPLNKFDNKKTPKELRDLCGWLPPMIESAFKDYNGTMQSLIDGLSDVYTIPVTPMGGNVTPEGVYTYPEDPDLSPIALITHTEHPGIKIYIYLYGIVAILLGGEQYMTRMD